MARTAPMRLLELMVLREDIKNVVKYLGEFGEFQFQRDVTSKNSDKEKQCHFLEVFEELQKARSVLDIEDVKKLSGEFRFPQQKDEDDARKIIISSRELYQSELDSKEKLNKLSSSFKEAKSFANLNVSYSELESLSFLTMRIGKIDGTKLEELQSKNTIGCIFAPLGEDNSKIFAACSKNNRLEMDNLLKEAGFVELSLPKDFKGVPSDVLKTLEENLAQAQKYHDEICTQRKNFALTHGERLLELLQIYCVASQIETVENNLESTEYVYRISGWIPEYQEKSFVKKIDEITRSRASIRSFLPSEVRDVINGQEKVPVQLKHGRIIRNFERMIFSYGSPLYGCVDPVPFVAIFFTLLFGIMFGDAGQGLVFLILGILMAAKKVKLGGWEKFDVVFIAIGLSSTIMGILTGEFFANTTLLVPLSRFLTGLFGEPRDVILHMMPSSDSHSILNMFMFFGFTVGVGFVINTCGIIINVINQFNLRHYGKAIFGKTGITGAVFFWYVISFALRVAFFGHVPAVYDWCIIGGSLFLTAFGEVFERLIEGHRPVFENGVFSAVIAAVVEIIEVLSSYLSNTVSFLRVGAFALAHAVLGFIIEMMAGIAPGPAGILVLVIGNGIVVVLEGMIVAIQVVRLQYYEFFSKFFSDTGREFKPFRFEYIGN